MIRGSLGPIMIDLEGTTLSQEERELIKHPLVGGLIFFTRNYESPEQIAELTRSIKQTKNILVCVDHEGGRVQRFRQGFTRLPACRLLGDTFDSNQKQAKKDAEKLGWLMAAELLAVGIDFSFAPVLDIDYGESEVIGDRAFHNNAADISEIAAAYMAGMKLAGMSNTGKHFPGHGWVQADSHLELPVDDRELITIMQDDMVPFQRLTESGALDAVMPAHVIYSKVDDMPAGFSSRWIKDILRTQLNFDGVVFSDDLNMAAAGMAGSFVERANAAMNAGCDMALVCNNRAGAIEVVDGFQWQPDPHSSERLERMRGRFSKPSLDALKDSSEWQTALNLAKAYNER